MLTPVSNAVLSPLLARHSDWSRVAMAILAPLAAWAIGWSMQDRVESYPTSQFVLAVVINAVYGGWRAALLATCLSTLILLGWFAEPTGRLAIPTSSDLLRIGLFIITALVISVLGQQVRSSARAMQTLADAVDAERAKLVTVIEKLPVAVGLCTPDGIIQSLNREGLRLHGFATEAEMLAHLPRYVEEFELQQVDGSPLPMEQWPLHLAMHGEYVHDFELRLRRRSTGVSHLLSYNVLPVRDTTGSPVLIAIVIQDLTQIRLSAVALAERTRLAEQREAELLAVLEQLPAAVWIVDERGGVKYISAATASLLGDVPRPKHADDYALYEGYWPAGHPRAGERLGSHDWALARSLTSGETVLNEPVEIVHARTGERRQTLKSSTAIRDARGHIAGGVAVVVDITELEETRRALDRARTEAERERQRLAIILDRLPVGVIVVDHDGVVVHHNRALEEVLGHPVVHNVSLGDLSTYGALRESGEPYRPEEYPIARALLHGEVILREITRYRRGDGRIVTLSISAAPISAPHEEQYMAVATIEDVSERESALAAAHEANASKTQFLRTMSHELRTPLHAIAGHVQLIELGIHGAINAEQASALSRVQRAQQHLLRLINDILEFARLDAGRVEFSMGPVALDQVVQDVLPMVEPMLSEQQVSLRVDLPAHEDTVVWADREKLAQVLLNLLSNAAKFTTQGGQVVLRVLGPASGSPRQVTVQVIDTGVGIAADRLAQIFEPFVQIDRGLTSRHEGTGLGLAITRDLVRGMGGEISVASEPANGSVFTVVLRVAEHMHPSGANGRVADER